MNDVPKPKSEADQIEVWKTLQEADWRAKDRALQEELAGTPWYKNALIVGIMVTAVTIVGNLVVSLINHSNTLETENFKAEGQRVLQALEAESPEQAIENLKFLLASDLISGDLRAEIQEYVDDFVPGTGTGAVIGIPRSDVVEPGLTLEFGDGNPIAALLVSHDDTRKGAFSPFLDSNEYDVSFGLSVEIAREIGNRGGKAYVLTRPTGSLMGFDRQIVQVAQRLDEIRPRIGLEIHFNAADSENARGTEVLFGTDSSRLVQELAKEIGETSAQILGTTFRGAKEISLIDRGGYLANGPETDALVVELFFGTNPQDSESFMKNRDQIVKALADTIWRWAN